MKYLPCTPEIVCVAFSLTTTGVHEIYIAVNIPANAKKLPIKRKTFIFLSTLIPLPSTKNTINKYI